MILRILVILISLQASAQQLYNDTVYITRRNYSNIVFHSNIVHVIYGSSDISSNEGAPISNTVNNKSVLVIKASRKFKAPTNISVITENDEYFDITCLYSEVPKKNFFFFGEKEKPKIEVTVQDTIKKVNSSDIKSSVDSIDFYQMAQKLYDQPSKGYRRSRSRNGSISIKFVGSYAFNDKLYLKIEILNHRALPYKIDYFLFYHEKIGGFRKQTTPETIVNPIYEYKDEIQLISAKSNEVKVFVFDQFSITEGKNMIVQMFEKGGQLDVELRLDSRVINNVKMIYDVH